jgi:N utilization substance protein A
MAKAEKTKKSKQPVVENDRERQGENLLRLVESMHREKNIQKDVIFSGIEKALQTAAQRNAGDEEDVLVHIDRTTGEIVAQKGDQPIDPEHLGRIAAQSAKQVMIQAIREAESEGVFSEFAARKGELVTGTIQRIDAGTGIVTLTKDGKGGASGTIEALLPRSEQIPGETHHVNDRVKAVVMDVRRNGHRVKIVLSRCHPDFVRSLFEQEIPEVQDHTIEIKAVAREAGYRSKVAVSSIDMKVDCVGACVGVRGSRIKNVIDELNGERIDIVRWNDSMQVMIPNALQPAEISEVQLYPRLGRAIVLVTDDQLSLAIGRRGQNVRLASKLVGWDIEIMTHEELAEGLDKAERWFSQLPHASPELLEVLITEGFLSYTDLTFLEPAQMAEMAGVNEEEGEEMIMYAEEYAEQMEEEEPAAAEPPAAEGTVVEGEAPATMEGAEGAVFLEQPPADGAAADAPVEVTAEGFESLFNPADTDTVEVVTRDENGVVTETTYVPMPEAPTEAASTEEEQPPTTPVDHPAADPHVDTPAPRNEG